MREPSSMSAVKRGLLWCREPPKDKTGFAGKVTFLRASYGMMLSLLVVIGLLILRPAPISPSYQQSSDVKEGLDEGRGVMSGGYISIFSGNLTVWTGDILLKPSVVVNGTGVLVIKNASVEYTEIGGPYGIVLNDHANLTIIDSKLEANILASGDSRISISNSAVHDLQIQVGDRACLTIVDSQLTAPVIAAGNSHVLISNSSVRELYVSILDDGSFIAKDRSTIGYVKFTTAMRIKPEVIDSTIVKLSTVAKVYDSLHINGDQWVGDYETNLAIENSSLKTILYELELFSDAKVSIQGLAPQIRMIYLYGNSALELTNATMSIEDSGIAVYSGSKLKVQDSVVKEIFVCGEAEISGLRALTLQASESGKIHATDIQVETLILNDHASANISRSDGYFNLTEVGIFDAAQGVGYVRAYGDSSLTLSVSTVSGSMVLLDQSVALIVQSSISEILCFDRSRAYITNSTVRGEFVELGILPYEEAASG